MDKIANIRVSDRAGEWARDVLEHFYTMYPELMNVDARVVFKKKDPTKGYGIGGVNLGAITVPIIIKDFEMSPIDVAVSQKGQIMPFNKYVVTALTHDTSAFKYTSLLKDSQSFKLLFGRNSLAAREDMIDASKGIEKNASAIRHLHDNWMDSYNELPLVKEWFEKQADVIDATADNVRDTLPRDICLLVKNASADYSYTGYIGSSRLHDIVEEHFYADQLPEDLRERKIIVKTAGVYHDKLVHPDATLITTSNLRSFAVRGDGSYTELPFTKLASDVNVISLVEKLASAPKAGDHGMFYVNEHFTEPMTILNVESSTEPEMMKIATFGGTFQRDFEVIRPIDDIVEGETPGKYYLPTKAVWVKLAEKDKTISRVFTRTNLPKVVKLDDNSYLWKGAELNSYATKHLPVGGPYNSKDTLLALMDMGASEQDLYKVAGLKSGESVDIVAKLELKPTIDEFLKAANDASGEFKPIFKLNELVKIAGVIKDKNTVDAVLGLGYLNANASQEEYFAYIPQLEEVAQRLSKLLLDIRLGALDMDGTIVSEALESLSQLIVTLKRLKQTKVNRRK